MSTTQVGIKLTLDGAQQTEAGLRRVAGGVDSLGQSAGNVGGGLSSLASSAGALAAGFGAAFAVNGLAAFANELVQVQRRFDVLNASLVTVSGSQAAAEKEFAWISRFAATTPYQLNEVTQAFVKLKNLGLDASKESLTSYGNTAAAMGKSLDQLIEAVADASTGEFERLKEFGIKASKQGDDIALTFRGVTTTIGDSADEITRYLRQIGDVDFAGAMELRANTLDGAVSNLADSWEGFYRVIARSGFGEAMANDTRLVSSELSLLTEVMENARKRGDGLVGVLADGLGAALGRLAFSGVEGVFNGFNGIVNALTGNVLNLNTNLDLMPDNLKSNADQVVILGAKLKEAEAEFAKLQERAKATPDNIYLKSEMAQLSQYIVKVREARDAKALLEGGAGGGRGSVNPQTVGQINADEEKAAAARAKARAEFDAKYATDGEKLKNELAKQRKLLGDSFSAEDERRVIASMTKVGAKVKEVGDAFAAERDAAKEWADGWRRADALLRGVTNEQLGLNKAQEQILEYLASPAYALHSEEMRRMQLETLYAADAQIKLNEEIAAEKRLMDAAALATRQAAVAAFENVSALKDQLLQQQLSNQELGLTGYALEDLRAARLEDAAAEKERLASDMASAGESDLLVKAYREQAAELRKLAAARRVGAVKTEVVDAAREAQAEWKRTTDEIERSLTDALMRGFEAGKGFGENLRDTLVNMFKTLVLRPVIQATVQGGLNAVGLGGPPAVGQAGGGGGLGNLNNIFGAGLQAYGGYTAGASAASLAYANSVSLVGGDALGALIAGNGGWAGVSAGAGAAAGGAGAMSSIAAAAPWLLGGLAVVSLLSGLDDSGTLHTGGAGSYSAGQGLRSGQSVDGLDFRPSEFSDAIASSSAAFSKNLVEVLDNTAKAFGKDAGYWAATGFADDTSKDGAWGALSIMRNGQSVLDWGMGADKWPGREFADGEKGSAEYLAAVAKDVRDLLIDSTPDWADAMLTGLGDSVTMEKLTATVAQINLAQAALAGLSDVMPQLAGMSDDATTALLGMVGGIDNLATLSKGYYEAYYSEAERAATTTRQVTDALADLGLGLPATREQFRALVEAQDLSTEGGRKTYAALLQLAPAFASVTEAVTQTASGITTVATQARDAAFKQLQASVDAEKALWQRQADGASTLRDEVMAVFDTLSEGINSLRAEALGPRVAGAQAQDSIQQALASARAGLGLPDADALANAIGQARGGMGMENYASLAEQQFAQLKLAGDLEELSRFAGDQLSEAERQLLVAQQQMEALDQTLVYWRDMLTYTEAGTEVNRAGYVSVVDAIADLQEAIKPGSTGRARQQQGAGGSGGGGGGGWGYGGYDGWLSDGNAPSGNGASTDPYSMTATRYDIYGGLLTQFADTRTAYEQAQVYLNASRGGELGLGSSDLIAEAMLAAGASQAQVDQVAAAAAAYQQFQQDTGRSPNSGTEFLSYYGQEDPYAWMNLPRYDVGTNYVPRDMLALIHEGEAVVPKAYNPAAGGQGISTQRLEALVEGLTAEVQRLQLVVNDGNTYQRRTAETLDNVTEGGAGMRTRSA